MKKRYAALVTISVLALFPISAAYAGGSDTATPYSVSVDGITLPSGVTFPDGGHVNIKSNQGDRGIHFESLNNQPSGQWIGQSFLPWSAFGYDVSSLCVTWVQVSLYNEHFGEGGQSPIGKGCEPCPTISPSPSPTVTSPSTPSATPSTTLSPPPSPSQSQTVSPSPSPSVTSKPTPTVTPSSSVSPEPTPSTSSSPTPLPSASPSSETLITPSPSSSPTSSTSSQSLPPTGGNQSLALTLTVAAVVLIAMGINLTTNYRRKNRS